VYIQVQVPALGFTTYYVSYNSAVASVQPKQRAQPEVTASGTVTMLSGEYVASLWLLFTDVTVCRVS